MSDLNRLAGLDLFQCLLDRIYQRQEVFDLIGSGMNQNDREFTASRILLMRDSLVNRDQDVVTCHLGGAQQLAIFLAFQIYPLSGMRVMTAKAVAKIER